MRIDEPTYYEQFRPLSRRFRFIFDSLSSTWTKNPVVLIESKWRLGDEIMMIPVYQALWENLHNDDHKYRIVAWCNYPELLESNPYVDAVNEEIARPQLYINLRGAERDVNRAEGYRRQLDLHSAMTVPKLYFEDWETVLWQEVPAGESPVVALCRGASWETKRWPVEHWNALAKGMSDAGIRVIVLGQDGEEIDGGTSFVGRTGVRDAACLLRKADLTISNDSGLMHLSLAAGTRTLGLFGPTDSSILIEDNPNFVPVTNERECQGCWNRDLSIETPGACPRNIDVCMETISVEHVLENAIAMLSSEET